MVKPPPVGGPTPIYPSGEGKKPEPDQKMLEGRDTVKGYVNDTFLSPHIGGKEKPSNKQYTVKYPAPNSETKVTDASHRVI